MRGKGPVEVPLSGPEPVRTCSECHRAKTIRGVWYLVPLRGPAPFVCEACFGHSRAMRAVI